jgi:hypothetical protein
MQLVAGVTNSKPLFGGGTGVTVLGQKTFNDTTMQKVRDAVNELVKGRNVIVAYNDAPTAIVTPETGAYEPIPLSQSAVLGKSLLFCVEWYVYKHQCFGTLQSDGGNWFRSFTRSRFRVWYFSKRLNYDGIFQRRQHFRPKHQYKRNI